MTYFRTKLQPITTWKRDKNTCNESNLYIHHVF